MSDPRGRLDPVDRRRMVLRVLAVLAAYVIYRLPGDENLPAGLALGSGTLLVLFVGVDRLTLKPKRDSGVPEGIRLLAGAVLIALGIALAVR